MNINLDAVFFEKGYIFLSGMDKNYGALLIDRRRGLKIPRRFVWRQLRIF